MGQVRVEPKAYIILFLVLAGIVAAIVGLVVVAASRPQTRPATSVAERPQPPRRAETPVLDEPVEEPAAPEAVQTEEAAGETLIEGEIIVADGEGLWPAPHVQTPQGRQFFVAPNGNSRNRGAREQPWDIGSTLAGAQPVRPGDVVWLLGGTYTLRRPAHGSSGFEVKLAGAPGRPIHVRAWPGDRVTIDGGLNIVSPSTHLWIWDVEITVSEPRPEAAVPSDPASEWPNHLLRPHGGLNINAGENCRFINIISHNNSQGVSWWRGSSDSELYGAIIYNNGFRGTRRGHGHAIYTQNEFERGVKTISDVIMTTGYGYSMHAYGSANAWVDNYRIEGCIVYDAGRFLVGGGRPSRGIVVENNYLRNVTMQIGYNAPHNEDCVVRNNIILNGQLSITRYNNAVEENNRIIAGNQPRPAGFRAVFRPNKYDPHRAHVAVFSDGRAASVKVEAGGFLEDGQGYRLYAPDRFFEEPISEGVYRDGAMEIPVDGDFAAFVVIKDTSPRW